jgi:hypothetical protein
VVVIYLERRAFEERMDIMEGIKWRRRFYTSYIVLALAGNGGASH